MRFFAWLLIVTTIVLAGMSAATYALFEIVLFLGRVIMDIGNLIF